MHSSGIRVYFVGFSVKMAAIEHAFNEHKINQNHGTYRKSNHQIVKTRKQLRKEKNFTPKLNNQVVSERVESVFPHAAPQTVLGRSPTLGTIRVLCVVRMAAVNSVKFPMKLMR